MSVTRRFTFYVSYSVHYISAHRVCRVSQIKSKQLCEYIVPHYYAMYALVRTLPPCSA